MKIEPICYRKTCFACERNKCTVLNNNNFGTNRYCPFYKTKEQVKKEKELYPNIYKED